LHNKHIVGLPIKPRGNRPANFKTPSNIAGSVKRVGNIKGGPHLAQGGGHDRFMGSQASGPNTVTEARGKHLA